MSRLAHERRVPREFEGLRTMRMHAESNPAAPRHRPREFGGASHRPQHPLQFRVSSVVKGRGWGHSGEDG